MTLQQHQTLLKFYKAELSGERDEFALNNEYNLTQLSIDRMQVEGCNTADAQEYLEELEVLIYK